MLAAKPAADAAAMHPFVNSRLFMVQSALLML